MNIDSKLNVLSSAISRALAYSRKYYSIGFWNGDEFLQATRSDSLTVRHLIELQTSQPDSGDLEKCTLTVVAWQRGEKYDSAALQSSIRELLGHYRAPGSILMDMSQDSRKKMSDVVPQLESWLTGLWTSELAADNAVFSMC